MQAISMKDKDREIERLKKLKKAVEFDFEQKISKLNLELESVKLECDEKDRVLRKLIANSENNDTANLQNDMVKLNMEIVELRKYSPSPAIKNLLRDSGLNFTYDEIYQKWFSMMEETKKVKSEAVTMIADSKMKLLEKIEDLENMLQTAQANLDNEKRKCEMLNRDLADLQDKMSALNNGIDEKATEKMFSKIEAIEIEYLEKETRYKQTILNLEEELRLKTEEKKDSLSRQRWLEENLKEKEKELEKFKGNSVNQVVHSQDANLDNGESNEKAKINELLEKVTLLQSSLDEMKKKVEKKKEKILKAKLKIKTTEDNLTLLKEKQSKMEDAITTRDKKLENLEQELSSKYISQITNLSEKIQELEQVQSKPKKRKLSESSSSEEEETHDLGFGNQQLMILEQENNDLRNLLSQFQNSEVAGKQDQDFQKLEKINDELKSEIQTISQEKEEAVQNLQKLQSEVLEINQKNSELDAKVKESQTKIEEFESLVQKLELENKNLNSMQENEISALIDSKETEKAEALKELKLVLEAENEKSLHEMKEHYKSHEENLKNEIEILNEKLSQKNELDSNIKFIAFESEIMSLKNTQVELETYNNELKAAIESERKNHEKEIEGLKSTIENTMRGGEAEILRSRNRILEEHIINIKMNYSMEIDILQNELEECKIDYESVLEKLEIIANDRDNLKKILDKLK